MMKSRDRIFKRLKSNKSLTNNTLYKKFGNRVASEESEVEYNIFKTISHQIYQMLRHYGLESNLSSLIKLLFLQN